MNTDDTQPDAFEDNESSISTGEDETFEHLLNKSGYLPVRLSPGQKVSARIISVSNDHVYIDLPGKTEGVIDSGEFRNDEGELQIQPGDEVEAYFLSIKDGIRRLTTLIHGYPATKVNVIRDAHKAGLPIDGEVKRSIKGGFEISVGGVKCFCPYSQIDVKADRDARKYIGKEFPFMVLEFKDDGRNIVVSRRVLIEQEKQARTERLQNTLEEGMKVTAVVSSIQKFGCFVDLGGIDGFVPTREISWDRINHPGEVVSIGQEITAKILSLDWENDRLVFSIKATQSDPWEGVSDTYPVGSRITGKIVRLVPFGAFVRLQPGVDGLIHISNLGTGRRINHPKEVLEIGQKVEAYIVDTNYKDRKIALSLQPKAEPKKIVLPEPGDRIDGIVDQIMPYGIFLKMNNGLNGLIPNAEMGTAVGTDHKKLFPPGTEMPAIVIEVDKSSNKVRLSRKAVLDKEAQKEYQEYRNEVRKTEELSGGFGSLGEILKAKLEEKEKSD